MKRILFLLLPFMSNHLAAQVSTIGMQDEFKRMAKLGKNQGAEGLQSYSASNVKGRRYLTETWSKGSVTTINDEVMDKPYLFMFDKINHDLYMKPKSAEDVLLVDKKQVKQFVITTGKEETFVNGSQIKGAEEEKFYTLLAGNSGGYAFYKLINTKFVKANKQDLARIKNGDFDDEYQDAFSYFITSSGQPLQLVKLSVNSLLKALPAESKKIKEYIARFDQYEMNEQFTAGLINHLNNP